LLEQYVKIPSFEDNDVLLYASEAHGSARGVGNPSHNVVKGGMLTLTLQRLSEPIENCSLAHRLNFFHSLDNIWWKKKEELLMSLQD
jgi:hypothetical protein